DGATQPTQRRLGRTLLLAAVCALIAMAFVPRILLNNRSEVRREYSPFYAMPPDSQINIAQLVVNVTFAALTGVVVANMSRRQLLWTAAVLAIAAAATLMVVSGLGSIVRTLSDQNLARRIL